MRTKILFLTGLLFLLSCKPPELGPGNLGPNQTNETTCIGGGCSAPKLEVTITAEGFVRDPIDSRFEDPTKNKPESGESLVDWLSDIFTSETSKPNPDFKPSGGSPPSNGGNDKPVVVGNEGPGGVVGPPNFDPDDIFTEEPVRDPPPKEKKWEDSELGKLTGALGDGISYAAGEITGENRKKRREAQRVKGKINEAKSVGEKITILSEEINKDGAAIGEMAKELSNQGLYDQTGTAFSGVTGRAGSHNTKVLSIYNESNDVPGAVSVPAAGLPYDTPELKAVKQGLDYANYVEGQVNNLPDGPAKERGRNLVQGARFALSSAEKAYREGQNEVGDYFMKVGTVLLDAGLGFVPGVGWAKDVYEFATGVNAITGEKLTTFERTMAAVGILTAGIGSKIAVAGKVVVLAGVVKSGIKNADEAADVAKLAEKGGEIAEISRKFGPKDADGVKELGEIFYDGQKHFDVAKSGGKHGGFYNQYIDKPADQIEKGIKSLDEQIQLHKDKIANPRKHIPDWDTLDPRQQEALLTKKWPGDIARQKEQMGILLNILEQR